MRTLAGRFTWVKLWFLVGCASDPKLVPTSRPGEFFRIDPMQAQLESYRPLKAPAAIPAVQIPSTLPSPATLADLTTYALAHHPQSRAAWLAAQAQAERLNVEETRRWPTLTGQGSITQTQAVASSGAQVPAQTRYGPSVSLAYLLYDFGARETSIEAERYRLLGANLAQNRVLQNIALVVEQAYYTLLGARERLIADERSLASAQAALEATQQRLGTGLGTRGEVYRARTARGEANLIVQASTAQLAKARGGLASALGLPVATELELVPEPETPPVVELSQRLDRLIEQAMQLRPDLAAAQAQAYAAWLDARATAAERRPSIEVSGNLGRAYFSSDRPTSSTYSLGLTLRMPLFDAGAISAQTREAEREAERLAAEGETLAQSIALAIWQAYYDWQAAGQVFSQADDVVASAAESEQAAQARYEVGLDSLLELLTAQADLARARLTRIAARLEWYTALARLNHALGATVLLETIP